MRFELFIGGICAAGLALTAVACGSSESSTGGNPDDPNGGETNASSSGGSSSGKTSTSSSGGSSGTTSSSSSGGTSSSGGLAATELSKDFSTITGIAGDQVIYRAITQAGLTLNAVPITGGASTKIADLAQGDVAAVRGGAVGVWKTVANGVGTFSVWTKATGLKAGPSASIPGLFTATADGTRLAISVNATATTSRFAVVDTANLATGTTFVASGSSAAAAISNTCVPRLRFAGTYFLGAWCTGSNTARARLVGAATPATAFDSLVSDASNNTGIQPYFNVSKNNTKVLVLGLQGATASEQLRIVTLPAGDVQNIDTDVYDGELTDDGSEVVYQTSTGGFKRASTGATPNPTEILPTASIKGIEAYTNDLSRILFASTDPDANGLVNLKTATTAAANTPADVATGVQSLGINATDTHFLYFAGDANGASLKAKPVGGGADKDIFKDPEVGLIPPSGAGVVVGHASKELMIGTQKLNVFSLSSVTMAGAATLVSTDVVEDEWAFKDTTLVYSKLVLAGGTPGAGTGLFAVKLP